MGFVCKISSWHFWYNIPTILYKFLHCQSSNKNTQWQEIHVCSQLLLINISLKVLHNLPCEWDDLEIKKAFSDALSSLPCIGPETISEVNN